MNKRGIIFQGVPGLSLATQLIVIEDGWYLVTGPEVTDSSLGETYLTSKELDHILGLSARIVSPQKTPLALEFELTTKGIELISSGEIDGDKLRELFQSSSSPEKLRGIPCSPGIVEAKCTQDMQQIHGKILVVKSIAAKDLPQLRGVSGLILESGNLLSHTSIITREMGIPCIIHVKNATRLFKDGVQVRMDGGTGEVKFVRPLGPHELKN